MSLKDARMPSLREKLEAKALTKDVDEAVESILDGEEPVKKPLKVKKSKK